MVIRQGAFCARNSSQGVRSSGICKAYSKRASIICGRGFRGVRDLIQITRFYNAMAHPVCGTQIDPRKWTIACAEGLRRHAATVRSNRGGERSSAAECGAQQKRRCCGRALSLTYEGLNPAASLDSALERRRHSSTEASKQTSVHAKEGMGLLANTLRHRDTANGHE